MKHALFLEGNREGKFPDPLQSLLSAELERNGFQVSVARAPEALADETTLSTYDLIVPITPLSDLEPAQCKTLCRAVGTGIGFAAFFSGRRDQLRFASHYQWMVGAQSLGQPFVGSYPVCLSDQGYELTEGLPRVFKYCFEQCYIMVDPSVCVLADTIYDYGSIHCRMPVVWTRNWGNGRVYYSALPLRAEDAECEHPVWQMAMRGLLWTTGCQRKSA